jgi:hypothetical protein
MRSSIEDFASAVRELTRPRRGTRKRTTSEPGRDRKQEARDKWIYKQCCKGREMPYGTIIGQLKKMAIAKRWEPIESIQGIRSAAMNYAERSKLPPIPNRQNL